MLPAKISSDPAANCYLNNCYCRADARNDSKFNPVHNDMKSKPGTYVLILQSETVEAVQIGKWGQMDLQPGYYAYVGSAFGPGGVKARVSRHCRAEKSKRWHIDYLREHAQLVSVWYSHSPSRLEHRWATALAQLPGALSIKRFGSSDCSCESHLYFFDKRPDLAGFSTLAKMKIEEGYCVEKGG